MKARLITAFIIIILIPMIIISVIISVRIKDILDSETDDKLSYTLFAISKMISDDIEQTKNRIDVIKTDPNVIEGVGFKDGSRFMGLIESAKQELDLEFATVFSWKEDIPEYDRGRFIIIDPNLSENNDVDDNEIAKTVDDEKLRLTNYNDNKKILVYIEDALIKDSDKIIGVIRFQKSLDDEYLERLVSNYKKLAGIESALFFGNESVASTFGETIKLDFDKLPDLESKLDFSVEGTMYQTKLARITETINDSKNNIHFLVGLSKDEANETINAIIILILIVGSVCTVLAILFGYIYAQWLSGKMNRTVSVVDRIAGGDLTERVKKEETNIKPLIFKKDEMSMVLESVGEMSEELIKIVQETMKGVNIVVEVAGELHNSNQELSQRAEIQASSIEEISATLEQMTSTIKSTAENSKKVRDLVEETKDKINTGEMIIAEAIMAMNLISESSKKISNITNVVDDIAFQTNLLSLNASVEAARAGEQGKGFAVVANEVRNLAQLSTNSVNDIKKLIDTTADRIEKGSTLVNKSGDILQEIVDKMKKVSISMQEVTEASSEQEIGIHHVNDAVQQIDSMIQKNTILADRTMILSDNMNGMAYELKELMSFFKLKKSDGNIKNEKVIDSTDSTVSEAEELFKFDETIENDSVAELKPVSDVVDYIENNNNEKEILDDDSFNIEDIDIEDIELVEEFIDLKEDRINKVNSEEKGSDKENDDEEGVKIN